MQSDLTIVIICKNEAHRIADTLRSVAGIAAEVLVYDTGSTDDTVAIAGSLGARVHRGGWAGFGPTRRDAVALASHDWILSIDSDEHPDTKLFAALSETEFRRGTVYRLQRRNLLGKRAIRFGTWAHDHPLRLFHRGDAGWDDSIVHETVVPREGVKVSLLPGFLLHHTADSIADYRNKLSHYAPMVARKYHREGRRAGPLLLYAAPVGAFLKCLLIKGGFLEGRVGWQIAAATAWYTHTKYRQLIGLTQEASNGPGTR